MMSDDDALDGEDALATVLPVNVAAMRAWMRMGGSDEEDGLLIDLIAAATGLCEAFIGQWVMIRQGEWRGRSFAGGVAVRLPLRPVVAIDSVAVMEGGAEILLEEAATAVVIDRRGQALVRLVQGAGLKQLVIRYRAGLADSQAAVPEALRHGIIRMVQHLYETRDAPGSVNMPPAAVAALWQPWRLMTLGGAG